MDIDFIAHVKKNENDKWDPPHSLKDHLLETARMTGKFASVFNSGEWGIAAGLAHDAGKGRLVWQNYLQRKSGYFDEDALLEGKSGKMSHAFHGSALVESYYGKGIGRILSYVIAGHHAGLPDWNSTAGSGQKSLKHQLEIIKDLDLVENSYIELIKGAKPSLIPWKFELGMDMALWIRMLYSCLVDSDFLDTERYMSPEKILNRGSFCSIEELLIRFEKFTNEMDQAAELSTINKIRREIRSKCVEAGKLKQGIFSLSVPTGGGKTLSSMAFALEHALQNKLERIIYVLPFTSIIEQNSAVFRSVLGDDQVIEHHSSLDEDHTTEKSRLAAENWDAPVIVTTSVQFFESLFAAKSSRCRKLHHIAGSVVILDEAQLVPVEYLEPILETMQLLVDHYHVSFVISTATQPAFKSQQNTFQTFKGLKEIQEIMGSKEDVASLYNNLKRTEIRFPKDFDDPVRWEDLSVELSKFDQVLCIVSDRKSCRELYQLMPSGTYHLSALMCGEHRSKVIEEIKAKLKEGETVRVISTQLVEAGVDFDFPLVYRAFAGLDSIAQAAGRCNREGKLKELGKVVVFISPRKTPKGLLRKAADTAQNILMSQRLGDLDHLIYEQYFSELYWKANSLDKEGIRTLLDPVQNDKTECSINFRTASEKFKIIDDSIQNTILVRYGEANYLIDQLKANGPDRWLMRKLQRYTVNIYNQDFKIMMQRGAIEEVYPSIYALSSNLDYSDEKGILIDEFICDPEQFII